MERNKFLAIDLGAESGRGMLGTLENEKMELQELTRFSNKSINLFNHLYWNIYDLFENIKSTFSECNKNNHIVSSVGVDTWGVDFVFLDKYGNVIGLPNMYRDIRTEGVPEKLFGKISKQDVYNETGIQFMRLNTLYQLYSFKLEQPEIFKYVDKILFIPDYLNFLLTGDKINEYTISSTSQIFSTAKGDWSEKILNSIGFSKELFLNVTQPGLSLGSVLSHIIEETGINEMDVVVPACHDTASAVVAVPSEGDDWAYLSSGTWSLIGIENKVPIINQETYDNNFTNEGGAFGTIRFLKNVVGLWLLQECRRIWKKEGYDVSYEEMTYKANKASSFQGFIIPDYDAFFNPKDMPKAINGFLLRTGQKEIQDQFSMVRMILECLALKYKEMINLLMKISHHDIKVLHIIGGGSKNDLLNQMTANATGIPVIAGPSEATTIGNLLMQAKTKGLVSNLSDIREIVRNSFEIKYFEPKDTDVWKEAYKRYQEIDKIIMK